MSGGKRTIREKLKAASQKERHQKLEEHFKNLRGKPPKIQKNLCKRY